MASVISEVEPIGVGWVTGRTETAPRREHPVHIWAGGGNVLCKSQHPLVVVRFDCVSRFSAESLCPHCIAAWE
jgi:hypothetical protein